MPDRAPAVHVLPKPLPRAAVEAAYTLLRRRQIPMSTLFVDVDALVDQLSEAMALPLALLVARHCETIQEEARALGYPAAAVFEIWSGDRAQGGPTVFLHIDNDEQLRKETGELRTPLFGSILYLGPDADLRGGGTFFAVDLDGALCDELLFEHIAFDRVVEAVGDAYVTTPFQAGRAVLFRGDLPHCIAPFPPNPVGPRVALLANGWAERPVRRAI